MSRRFFDPTQVDRTTEPTDSIGTVIRSGKFVAYNRSGTIVPGVVQRVRVMWERRSYGLQWRGDFHVKCELDGKISCVKNPHSILVTK